MYSCAAQALGQILKIFYQDVVFLMFLTEAENF